jgi:hypothetical protein
VPPKPTPPIYELRITLTGIDPLGRDRLDEFDLIDESKTHPGKVLSQRATP